MMAQSNQLLLDNLRVEERIRYTPKEQAEITRIRGVMDNLNHVTLLMRLRDKPLCYVIRAWHEANAPKEAEQEGA